ncbi:restriction endonuclease subunit S [Chromohalobacter sp. HP20-39]|uniref:restriction endonuclease subunit S n=1 Tax=Chromohalobacter sp. HP20-39 TaxID=3079306 RepID=UPI00294AC39C|nr:restriction endonuclease subunit S [Chromohalobacter sp. HP20-39]MDV6318677.1 restriction endonuclease subunit S [Chromohalobacter sp. HP20-39]
MGGEWSLKTLNQLGRIVTGRTPPSSVLNAFGKGIPFVTPSDFDGRRDISVTARELTKQGLAVVERATISEGSVMVSCIGSDMGKAARATRASITNQQINSIVVESEDDPLFVYYNLSNRKEEFRSAASGSAQPILNKSAFGNFQIKVPPLSEQRAIAHVLGSLDDKIELNRQMNRTLEQMAQALFKSWFIDFDPVVYNAIQAGNHVPERFQATAERYRQNPEVQTLPQHILELFSDRFEDSELGKIPAGWGVKPIGDSVNCVGGATPSTKKTEFWEGGTNSFLTPKDMSSLVSPVITDTSRHITDAGVEKISSKRIPSGAVMFSSRAPIGYLGINEMPTSINQGVIAMICDGELPNHYVLLWTMANMELIKSKAGGTTFAEISKKNFRPINVLVPEQRVLTAFTGQVEPMYTQISENVFANGALIDTRDTLLPKLISGEMRIPDTEKLSEGS